MENDAVEHAMQNQAKRTHKTVQRCIQSGGEKARSQNHSNPIILYSGRLVGGFNPFEKY